MTSEKLSRTALQIFQNQVQLAAFHYIVCMKTKPSSQDHEITYANKAYAFEGIQKADNDELHWEFQQWTTHVVIRDILEHFSIFLLNFYLAAKENRGEKLTEREIQRFEFLGIEDQLKTIYEEFEVDKRWIDRVVAFNRVRNCLSHRNGVVSDRDITKNGRLIIHWLEMENVPEENNPDGIYEAKGEMQGLIKIAKKGQLNIGAEIVYKQKHFVIGEKISFLPNEYFQILIALQATASLFSNLK